MQKVGRLLAPCFPLFAASLMVLLASGHLGGISHRAMALHPQHPILVVILHITSKELGDITVCALSHR